MKTPRQIDDADLYKEIGKYNYTNPLIDEYLKKEKRELRILTIEIILEKIS